MCTADTYDLATGISMGNELGAGSTDMELRIGCERIVDMCSGLGNCALVGSKFLRSSTVDFQQTVIDLN